MKLQVLHTVWRDILVRLQEKFEIDHSWGWVCSYLFSTTTSTRTFSLAIQVLDLLSNLARYDRKNSQQRSKPSGQNTFYSSSWDRERVDTKMWIFLPCLKESAQICYPVQDWPKHSYPITDTILNIGLWRANIVLHRRKIFLCSIKHKTPCGK